MADKEPLEICCLNCHYYLSDYENCQGMINVEEDNCFEYKETLFRKENKT